MRPSPCLGFPERRLHRLCLLAGVVACLFTARLACALVVNDLAGAVINAVISAGFWIGFVLVQVVLRQRRHHAQRLLTAAEEHRRHIARLEAETGLPILREGTCARCQTALVADAPFCPGCGSDLAAAAADRIARQICAQCGARLPEDATYCAQCGTRRMRTAGQDADADAHPDPAADPAADPFPLNPRLLETWRTSSVLPGVSTEDAITAMIRLGTSRRTSPVQVTDWLPPTTNCYHQLICARCGALVPYQTNIPSVCSCGCGLAWTPAQVATYRRTKQHALHAR